MKTTYSCWDHLNSEEEDATEIAAHDVEDAARFACEKWESLGHWSGDPLPNSVQVSVRRPDGALFLVEIGHEYSVSFYSNKATAQ